MVKVDLRISDTEWKIFHFEGKISRQLILPVGKKKHAQKKHKKSAPRYSVFLRSRWHQAFFDKLPETDITPKGGLTTLLIITLCTFFLAYLANGRSLNLTGICIQYIRPKSQLFLIRMQQKKKKEWRNTKLFSRNQTTLGALSKKNQSRADIAVYFVVDLKDSKRLPKKKKNSFD